MKTLTLLTAVLMAGFASRAQVGIGTATPNSEAALDVSSSTKALLLPRLTTTAMNAIAQPEGGMMVYNTTENRFYGYAVGPTTTPLLQPYYDAHAAFTPMETAAQSFTPPARCTLESITVQLSRSGIANQTAIMKIRQGAGLAGTVIATVSATVTASVQPQPVTFTMPAGTILQGAMPYTYTLEMPTGTGWQTSIALQDLYSGGHAWLNSTAEPTLDYLFEIVLRPFGWRLID